MMPVKLLLLLYFSPTHLRRQRQYYSLIKACFTLTGLGNYIELT